jgi:hypothetical protein
MSKQDDLYLNNTLEEAKLAIIYNDLLREINSLDKLDPKQAKKHLNNIKRTIKSNKKQLEDFLLKIKSSFSKDKIKPSHEQQTIIDCVSLGNNIYVDAVAGSGKTTVCIFIAKKNRHKNILQVTYNKHLKNEVREKVKIAGVDNNLEINTYHSLGVKFYDESAKTDDGIIKILETNRLPRKKRAYDIIIIDECQDMTPIYYEFINKFLIDMGIINSQLMLMGDRYQSVYQFKKADPRFLTLANHIWKPDIKLLPLQQSFRVTKPIAYFINRVLLGYDRILSTKEGAPVLYMSCNRFSCHFTICNKIKYYMKKYNYRPDDFFVIAPTIKSTDNPIKRLENKLVENGIPVYYSRQEEESLNEEIIAGKVIFTTFHQSKGRERKVVIVFGFDASYFKFFARDKDPHYCPEELYVAVSRPMEHLILIEDATSGPVPFLKFSDEEMYNDKNIIFDGKIDYDYVPDFNIKIEDNLHEVSVTELTMYLNEENNQKLIPLIDLVSLKKKDVNNIIELPLSIKTDKGLSEDVSDLNGIAIPSIYEFNLNKTSTIYEKTKEIYNKSFYNTNKNDVVLQKLNAVIISYKDNLPEEERIRISLNLSNAYICLSENILSKFMQVTNYNWLTPKMVKECMKNISSNVGSNIKFEEEIGDLQDDKGCFYQHLSNEYGLIKIRGRMDAVDDDNIWEFKCVEDFKREHILQLIIYAWVYEKCMKSVLGSKKYKILNIRTGELILIKYESYIVEEIMNILFENKFGKVKKLDDTKFIDTCIKAKKRINNKEIKEIIKKDSDKKDSDKKDSDKEIDKKDSEKNNKKIIRSKRIL